jgi:cell wall-associated NlpC family hydrolase
MKSFDCSGFVWRVHYESGVLVKRTTARKYYFALPPAEPGKPAKFGTLVFFDDLKHIGIVNDAGSFFHAQTSKGTTMAPFDPYWRPKITGYRRIIGAGEQ